MSFDLSKERFNTLQTEIARVFLVNTTHNLILNKDDRIFIVKLMESGKNNESIIEESLKYFYGKNKHNSVIFDIIQSSPFILKKPHFNIISTGIIIPENYNGLYIGIIIKEIDFEFWTLVNHDESSTKVYIGQESLKCPQGSLTIEFLDPNRNIVKGVIFNILIRYFKV